MIHNKPFMSVIQAERTRRTDHKVEGISACT